MNKDILLISFSAFFADLGYQAVQAIFPIYLVITLSTNALDFGIANALAYGGGALFAYYAGLIGVRRSRKWLAVLGSAFLILMPMVGLAINPAIAIALFAAGWWARNFRVPPRRAMLTDSASTKNLGKVFGFLHALDIGGGMVSIAIVLILLGAGTSQNNILLLTAFPIIVSTSLLVMTRDIRRRQKPEGNAVNEEAKGIKIHKSTYKGVILATALYGFSYYSLGFPILTIAQSSNMLLGVGSYGVYLGVSAIAGYYIGSRARLNKIKALGYLGYILSGIGTAILALAYATGSHVGIYYLGVALMGIGLGTVETMEPTIVSLLHKAVPLDKGMGALQGSRSLGLFFANLIMGILYLASPSYSYIYAAIVSIVAGAIVLVAGRDF